MRNNKPGPWRFYVYEIFHDDLCLYIGKGSSSRLRAQIKAFNCQGREIARFKFEKDSYEFEKVLISERRPFLNKNPGGIGSYATKKRKVRLPKWEKDFNLIGPRRFAARALLQFELSKYFKLSEIETIKQVANGEWC